VKPLAELNELLARILTTMYDHNHSARGMAKGMLQSLLEPDPDDAAIDDSSSGSVLQPTLAVHPSLAYGKRSGGERKRVDLALFFSLMQLMWARSAHRAHYMLVDEVFDSLDEAGQAAVVRWCGLMSQTVAGWIVVITHSQFLIERNVEEDAGKVSVMRARMGEDGMELVVDARRIGVQ
jgi:recombinational DNA repair ATPase RecF